MNKIGRWLTSTSAITMAPLETLGAVEARFHRDQGVEVFTSLPEHLCLLFQMNSSCKYWSIAITRLLLPVEG
jgi:hypothetical protein